MTRNRDNIGSALILSLWALMLLSAAVFAWVKLIDQDISVATQANAELEALAFAHSGVNVAVHPNVSRATPILHKRFSPARGYDVRLTSEAGKLNLRWLFREAVGNQQSPLATAKLTLFKRYLERRGLTFEQRQALVDCILDWLDPDNLQRINGAEEEPNYHPPNRGEFLSVDELAQVKNSKPLTSQAGWRDDFTIFSQPGLIDLQSAPLELLEILPNVGDANARRFLQIRAGPDKLDGTEDDRIFKDLNEALRFLNIGSTAAQELAQFVTVEPNPPILRIESVGQSGKVYRQIEAVAGRVQGGQPTFLWWKEL
jgi:type II secretory pathway component PulK